MKSTSLFSGGLIILAVVIGMFLTVIFFKHFFLLVCYTNPHETSLFINHNNVAMTYIFQVSADLYIYIN